jgi:hypothetical protein
MAEQLHPRPPRVVKEAARPVTADHRRRSSLQRARAAGTLPIPPPRRHRVGSWLPRSRSPNPPQPDLLTKPRPEPAQDVAHHGRRREQGLHRRPAPPEDAGEKLLGRQPTAPKKKPNLLAVQGGTAVPLPGTPAGEAAGGEGEGRRRVNGASQGGTRGEGLEEKERQKLSDYKVD